MGDLLGKGRFGQIRSCTHKTTGQVRAVKCFNKSLIDEDTATALFDELVILKTLDHPNIIKLYEAY